MIQRIGLRRDRRRLSRLALLFAAPLWFAACIVGNGVVAEARATKPILRQPPQLGTKGYRVHGQSQTGTVEERSNFLEATDKERTKEDRTTLFLIRLLFLTYYGSLGSLMPYLPVYYHSLGHGGQIIGMVGAVKPLTTFLVAPFWGIVADKTGNRFGILYFTFLVSLVGQLLVSVRNDVYHIMTFVFITAVFNAPVKSLIDSMVIEKLSDRSRYGQLRLWGQLGFGIGSSGVGILLSRSSSRARALTPVYAPVKESLPREEISAVSAIVDFLHMFWHSITGYKLLFLTYAALSVPTWWCMRAFHAMDRSAVEKVSNSEKAVKEKGAGIVDGLLLLLHNGDAILFFFLVFVVGVSSGVIENFAYVRIREVGGTGKEMGLSRLVSSVAGAPMFWFSGPLTKLLGADRVLVLSLLSYVTRFVIYAAMRNPYHGLPAEALRGVTFAAFWSTGTIYASRISPPGLDATMLMFLNAMYGGLGQSVGSIIGGKLQSKVGTVNTFLYAAMVDLCFVITVVLYLSLRKDSNFRNPTPILPKEESNK